MTQPQQDSNSNILKGKVANSLDILKGRAANGLAWSLEGINYQNPPADKNFYTQNGRRFLRSSSWERKKSHQKDRPRSWYTTVYENVNYTESEEGESDVFSWKTPVGAVIGRRHENHFSEYPVKSLEDLDVWTYVHSHMRFCPNTSWAGHNNAQQLTTIGLNWSPVQQLLQFDMGIENFYYFLMDAPEKMATLLDTMQARCLERLQLGLSLFPNASIVQLGENTSSSLISPAYYRQLTLPHIQAYAGLVHQHNKRLIIHMCGLLKSLLDCFVLTGLDGIHSVTPPPLGDTPYALVREKFGQDFTIIGRFNAHLWVGRSKEEILKNLRQAIYPQLLNTPFILLITSDAIPDIPYENVMTLIAALDTI